MSTVKFVLRRKLIPAFKSLSELNTTRLRSRSRSRSMFSKTMSTAKYSTVKLFTDEKQAELYAKFRPKYSKDVFEQIISFCQEKTSNFELAIDVGCGSGQSTVPLTKHFQQVIGVDVSPQQIDRAPKDIPNLSFKVSPAEELEFAPNSSTDLVTVAQAFHWVDQQKFYKEVDRILKPSGSLVLYGYGICQLSHPEANKYFNHLYNDVLPPYWAEGRKMVEQKYSTVSLPYPEWRRDDSLRIELECTVDDFVGYLGSWSAVQTMIKEKPDQEFLQNIRAEFHSRTSHMMSQKDEEVKVKVVWPVFMLMGRKP